MGRSFQMFESARAAFRAELARAHLAPTECILLPAYIGWSPREGSGVFDPIAALGLRFEFYPLDLKLRIDVPALERAIEREGARALLLIHYFGRVDESCDCIAALARDAGLLLIEDCAHAMLSDLVGGVCGRLGDAALYSLHKMLPEAGGVLVRNGVEDDGGGANRIWRHDLGAIARRRRQNALRLAELLGGLGGEVEPLWDDLPEGVVPQTWPVRLRYADRNAVYREMNAAGYGVVSLYHTMIAALPRSRFPEAHELSRTILNLPIHQDVDERGLAAIARMLEAVLTVCRV
jgi:dTDP-4-amino-4,6-dideoxygalactose transaminase